MIESCHTCRFWAITTFTLLGQCRRRAPTIDTLHDKLNYPETPMQHWCGEYEVIEYRRKELLDTTEVKTSIVDVWKKRTEDLKKPNWNPATGELFSHGEVNANVQSQSKEAAGVGSDNLREEQSESERDCGTTDSAEPELLQASASHSDDRSSGTGVGEAGDPTSGRGSLIENKCQDCSKTFMIDFECAVCNDCYSKRQGRKRHYMG